MKKKLLAVLVAAATCVTATVGAYAACSKNYYYRDADAYVHGYVDFADKFINTYVWCNVSLGGAERDDVSAKYVLKTDKKTIKSKGELNYRNLKDTYTQKEGGRGASYAQLIVKYEVFEVTFTQKD